MLCKSLEVKFKLKTKRGTQISGLYNNHMMIISDNSNRQSDDKISSVTLRAESTTLVEAKA
jgi:hypothetical protein